MVRIMGDGDYLVPPAQGERLRDRRREADALPLEERNAAVRELIAEVIREGREAPKGSGPDLVLAELPPEMTTRQQPDPRPAGDKTDDETRDKAGDEIRYRRERWRDVWDDRRVGSHGSSHDSLTDIDPTDRPRG